jgi:hypothetical protein
MKKTLTLFILIIASVLPALAAPSLPFGPVPQQPAIVALKHTTDITGGPPTNAITLPNPLRTKTITGLLNDIAIFLLNISVIIAGIMVIYGAFQILTAGAVPENIEKGKKTILYAVVGLGIMLLFKVLIAIIAQLLDVQVNL